MNLTNIIDIQQAALITGMAVNSIHYHIRKGHLKASRIGHSWLIDNRNLISFIAARNSGKYCKSGRPKRSPALETTAIPATDLFETVIPGKGKSLNIEAVMTE